MFKITEVEEFYSGVVFPKLGEPVRIDINQRLVSLRTKSRKSANKNLLPWIVLIDEGIHFLYFLELMISSQKKGQIHPLLASLIARLRSLAISFRELILLGQAESSKLILRGFAEASDLTLVAMSDLEFCKKFAPKAKPDNHDYDFWKNNIGYGKIYIALQTAMEKADFEEKEIQNILSWKKELKTSLSGSVHTDASSTQLASFIPSLTYSGMFSHQSFGHLSIYSPSLCTALICDIVTFSGVFHGLVCSSDIPEHLKGFPASTDFASTVASHETLHEYYQQFEEQLKVPIEDLYAI